MLIDWRPSLSNAAHSFSLTSDILKTDIINLYAIFIDVALFVSCLRLSRDPTVWQNISPLPNYYLYLLLHPTHPSWTKVFIKCLHQIAYSQIKTRGWYLLLCPHIREWIQGMFYIKLMCITLDEKCDVKNLNEMFDYGYFFEQRKSNHKKSYLFPPPLTNSAFKAASRTNWSFPSSTSSTDAMNFTFVLVTYPAHVRKDEMKEDRIRSDSFTLSTNTLLIISFLTVYLCLINNS